ncbi:DUF4247 domain-containing protein [Thalassobacillus hwangdonensis]|uniref:DUF4247 domain-containing protein n=1 Tax=Thalassobacillus hwangdonensis TaxID=546108 RepID=A0ABW3L5H7_9BACI
MNLKLAGVVLFIGVVLTGCSTIDAAVDNNFPMEDIVYDDQGNTSKVYRAYGRSVEKAATIIQEDSEPLHKASKDGKNLMIYDDYLVQVYKDIENPDDSLVEISGEKFVRNNYDSAFFTTYGIANEAEDEFDMDLDNRSGGSYIYTGYIGKSGYVKNSGNPSVRMSSDSSSGVRGGGPGAGK